VDAMKEDALPVPGTLVQQAMAFLKAPPGLTMHGDEVADRLAVASDGDRAAGNSTRPNVTSREH